MHSMIKFEDKENDMICDYLSGIWNLCQKRSC